MHHSKMKKAKTGCDSFSFVSDFCILCYLSLVLNSNVNLFLGNLK